MARYQPEADRDQLVRASDSYPPEADGGFYQKWNKIVKLKNTIPAYTGIIGEVAQLVRASDS